MACMRRPCESVAHGVAEEIIRNMALGKRLGGLAAERKIHLREKICGSFGLPRHFFQKTELN
jgi:hypothetical protein